MTRIAVVGAGFSGAVIAHSLAQQGYQIDVFEARDHVAGNCFTRRDPRTGILVHVYGPHIFHTNNERVWAYVNRYEEFVPFTNRVKAITNNRVFSLPINLMTINQFFGKTFSPEEAREFLASLGDQTIKEPKTFEDQALRFVGRELYEAFFKEYTIKQWGVKPSELPASLLKRLPIRFNYDDNYYTSTFQGIPKNGYTPVIEKLLDHVNVNVHLNVKFDRAHSVDYDHTFYSGPIDAWFNYQEGRLAYRTLEFAEERHQGDYQGNPVINYCGSDVAWTRITEHKHFSPWESHANTIIYKEYSRACADGDIEYYPLRLAAEKTLLSVYRDLAIAEGKVTFLGRLGTYRYLDMHVAVSEAFDVAATFLNSKKQDTLMPPFLVDPLGAT